MVDLKNYSDEELIELSGTDINSILKNRGYNYGWYKETEYTGVIYILVNPAFPELVKIGYTDNIQSRLNSMNSQTNLPDPYHVYATYKVKKRLTDLKLHELIDSLDSDLRHAQNREFYNMSPEKAYNILSAIAQINGDENLLELNPLKDAFWEKEYIQNRNHSHSNRHTNEHRVEKKKQHSMIEHKPIPDGTYFFNRNKKSDNRVVQATAVVKDGEWTILKGSILGIKEDSGVNSACRNIRKNMKIDSNGVLEDDFLVGKISPSTSGCLVINQSSNGWFEWKDTNGKRLSDICAVN